MKLADFIPTPVKVGFCSVAAVAVIAAGWTIYNSIYESGWQDAAFHYEQKMKEQREANERAIAEAKLRLNTEITRIRQEKERLEDALERIEAEADTDPRANSLGISADSVRRLRAIR